MCYLSLVCYFSQCHTAVAVIRSWPPGGGLLLLLLQKVCSSFSKSVYFFFFFFFSFFFKKCVLLLLLLSSKKLCFSSSKSVFFCFFFFWGFYWGLANNYLLHYRHLLVWSVDLNVNSVYTKNNFCIYIFPNILINLR